MHDFVIVFSLEKKLKKLKSKDPLSFARVRTKIHEIISSDVSRYKNLRYSLKDCKRVHIGSYVLIFSYDAEENLVTFYDYEHHDTVYEP